MLTQPSRLKSTSPSVNISSKVKNSRVFSRQTTFAPKNPVRLQPKSRIRYVLDLSAETGSAGILAGELRAWLILGANLRSAEDSPAGMPALAVAYGWLIELRLELATLCNSREGMVSSSFSA